MSEALISQDIPLKNIASTEFTLQEVYEKCMTQLEQFPLDMAMFIMIEVCKQLQYDQTEISCLTAKNIRIRSCGEIRLVSFEQQNEKSQEELISYMAPELIKHKQGDIRAIQFNIAAIFWELLAGRRLFLSKSKKLTMQRILQTTPPKLSQVNQIVPSQVDQIFLKALDKEASNRFKDLEELGRELSKVLYRVYPGFHSDDLKYFTRFLFSYTQEQDDFTMVTATGISIIESDSSKPKKIRLKRKKNTSQKKQNRILSPKEQKVNKVLRIIASGLFVVLICIFSIGFNLYTG